MYSCHNCVLNQGFGARKTLIWSANQACPLTTLHPPLVGGDILSATGMRGILRSTMEKTNYSLIPFLKSPVQSPAFVINFLGVLVAAYACPPPITSKTHSPITIFLTFPSIGMDSDVKKRGLDIGRWRCISWANVLSTAELQLCKSPKTSWKALRDSAN